MQKVMLLYLVLCMLACTHSQNTPVQEVIKTPIVAKPVNLLNAELFADSGNSSITLKKDTVNGFSEIEEISRTRSYHFIRYAQYDVGNMGPWHALVSELSLQKSRDAPSNIQDGKIILNTYVPNTNPIQNKQDLQANKWCDTLEANAIRYGEEFIESTKYRDGLNPLRSLYKYWDGNMLMTFSSDFYGIEHPKDYSNRRYIGYLDKPVEGETAIDSIERVYGVLTYVDPVTNHAQHLLIKSEPDDGPNDLWRYESFDKLSLSGLQQSNGIHYSNHKGAIQNAETWGYSDFKHFEIILTYSGLSKITIHIPIINDRIDISHLHSKWFEFELR